MSDRIMYAMKIGGIVRMQVMIVQVAIICHGLYPESSLRHLHRPPTVTVVAVAVGRGRVAILPAISQHYSSRHFPVE